MKKLIALNLSDVVFIMLINVKMPIVGKMYRQKANVAWKPGYKTFFMLNLTEHEISTAHLNENINK